MAIHTRLNPDDYPTWVSTVLQQKTTSRTTAHVPVVTDSHDAAAAFQMADTHFQQAAAGVAKENASEKTE